MRCPVTSCRSTVLIAALVLVLTGCAVPSATDASGPTSPTGGADRSADVSRPGSPSVAARQPGARRPGEPDPRWEFYVRDRTQYASPWWARRHRIMIGFGCTQAPYYSPDQRCRDDRGFHHGVDIAMPCGTRLFAAIPGRVVPAEGIGPAYGEQPLLLRNQRRGIDVLIAHADRLHVSVGDRVRRGDLVARAGDSGAPDGCHLHFEKRAAGGGLDSATRPRRLMQMRG